MLTARYAALVKEFRLTMPQVYELTPRQIHDVYFHPRDKDGALILPEVRAPAPGDDVGRLAGLLALAPALGVPADQIEKLRRRLEAISGDTRGTA